MVRANVSGSTIEWPRRNERAKERMAFGDIRDGATIVSSRLALPFNVMLIENS